MSVSLLGSMRFSATSFPLKLLSEIDNSPIQFTGRVNVSDFHDNCTGMTIASATASYEIHKPLIRKSSQEIQKEKEEILKTKLNASVFTQQVANHR
jgi:hypothetical protein